MQPIQASKLRVGMYVDLNCSWFQHPFASKTFKIKSENELAVIIGLGLNSILVNPDLSDPETTSPSAMDESNRASESAAAPGGGWATHDSHLNQPCITRYKESLHLADTVYKQSLEQSSKALDDIRNGSEKGLATAKEMVDNLTDLILDDTTSSAMGSLLAAQDLKDPGILHAMNVSVLSMLVGRQFGFQPDELKILGIAGLMHDIGEHLLPPDCLERSRGMHMTAEDRKLFEEHVNFASYILTQFSGLPDGVTKTIWHHHERADGSGYPSQLQGNQLPLPSKILMVVDEYESLINAPNIMNNKTPTEALSQIYLQSKTKFSEDVVVALIQILSVYPPGTVVELNDKSIGLVISINLQARMRPLIILYDATVDRENPKIIDLGRDNSRTIMRSITRRDLPEEVSEYLNLSRWTGYFINSSMKTLKEAQAA